MFTLEPNDTQAYVKDDGTLVMLHKAGFFSCCTIRMVKILQYLDFYKRFPSVDSSEQWKMYRPDNRDVTDEYFKYQPDYLKNPIPITFSNDNREIQYSDFKLINYNSIYPVVSGYFAPSDQVNRTTTDLVQRYGIDINNTIAILYRGTDKRKETIVPEHSEVIGMVQIVRQKFPNHKILIQTDEIDFWDAFKREYPNSIHFEEVYMVNRLQESVQNYIHNDDRINKAVHFLAIMNIIAKCDQVILNSGNVGMWCCLYRGNANNVYQFLDGDWI